MYSEIDEKDKGMLEAFVTFMQEVKTFARLPSAQQYYEPASEILKKMNSFLLLLIKYKKLGEEMYISPDINKLCAVVNKKTNHLWTLARKYFKDYYKDQEINFAFILKKNGDQLGELVDLTLKNGQQIRCFIKTHRHGTTKTSSSTKDVDLKEVFIYKVLELLGIGEETHFFYDPIIKNSFFIVVKDAGHSKKGKNKKFCLNEELKNKCIAPDGIIAKIEEKYVKGIFKVYYTCRIMRLTDVLTNISNAGFVIHEEVQRVKPKIIDFQIISSSNYKVVDPFAAFCAGNREVGSYEANPVLAELFSSNNLKTRIQQTEEIIKELEHGVGKRSSLEKALTDSFTIISLKLFKERSTWLDRNALTEITGFSFDINENHITLKEEIENYLKQNP